MGEVVDASWRKVEQGLDNSGELERIYGDELGNSDELDGARKSSRGNDEMGRAESLSITGVVEVGRDVNVKIVSTNLT